MGGKKSEVSGKKAAGNARKAESAAEKAAAEQAKRDAAEAAEWSKGSKSNAKKEAEAAKKAEAARKKAERDALIAQEEASLPSRAAPKKSKTAVKKTAAPAAPARGLDLSQLDDEDHHDNRAPASALNASGIDNALDALSLATAGDATAKVDRHPERRFKAALAAFEERRLREMDSDGSGQGLRQNQKKEKIRKEFERSPENPFNQVSASYDASKEELARIKEAEKAKIEARLASK